MVTDSTAYLPADVVERHALTVVPLQVVVGGKSLAEGVEVTSDEVALALREWRPVTTSRPSPQTFAETYRSLGTTEVVSVHLSADLSGTADAARIAARQVAGEGIAVTVVDSRSLGMGLGFVAVAAARAAVDGAVRRRRGPGGAASRTGGRHLAVRGHSGVPAPRRADRRGGRRRRQRPVGEAAAAPRRRAARPARAGPDHGRALARLEELAAREAGDREVDVAVQHLAAPERAGEVAQRLRARLPKARSMYVGEVGAVVGAHVGPGMLGVVVAPAS